MSHSLNSRFLKLLSIFISLSVCMQISAKDYTQKIFLWDGIPKMETQKRDTILYYCPPAPDSSDDSFLFGAEGKKAAVIICPGGSYHHLGMPHEGFASARWFSSHGFAAFVLRYRVAYNCHHYPDQLEDIQMAIVYIREHAEEFGIDKNKVGAIGYSAGGHLVTMAGEFASTHNELPKLGIDTKESVRPDFVMPVYPVVSMQDDIGHKWSRRSLLGHQWKTPNAEKGWRPWNFWGHAYSKGLKDEFSMELNVPDDMPPTFILACEDDPVVIYENSVRLEKALAEKNIPHIFVSYPKGGHGFGMKENSFIMKETHWNDEKLLPWLKEIIPNLDTTPVF
ncbi:MAG: alpha/beta hydrolase [Treponema sp.]|nr:alpha/beta hydrolase [Treponema sp.]